MGRTRIAVAGAGLIGLAHMARAQASPTCELSAVVDPAPAARETAERAGVPLYPTLDALFAATQVDGVVLATPNRSHVEQALRCIEGGVAVLVEKPVADTVDEAERLAIAVEAKGARVLVGHHRTHSPIMVRAKALIEEGRLGRIVAVMGSAVFFKPDHYFERGPWRREPGGGPILINLIHEVHNLRMLCGEIVAVQAFASNARARLPGRGHRRDQPALRQRRAGHVHALRHGRLPPQLGADVAGERGLRELCRRGLLRDRRHVRLAVGADDAAQDLCQRGGPLVVEALRRPTSPTWSARIR